jgi:thioredoxin 1
MSDATPFVSDADFEKEVLKSSEPVVVDFYAEWCGPCKAMSPALEAVANDLKGKVKVVKLDVDQNPSTAAKYDIRAMPTLLVFKDGQVVNQKVGAMVQKKQLQDWINGTLTG